MKTKRFAVKRNNLVLQRHNNYNRTVEELQAVYELGVKDCNANLQKIKAFINLNCPTLCRRYKKE